MSSSPETLVEPWRPLDGNAEARPRAGGGGDGLRALVDPGLTPIFWRAERIGEQSAWWQHVPFAHWLVTHTAPRAIVELGTHAGVSYAALCQAVLRCGLDTRCHAVDTWRGDSQAGYYDSTVYDQFRHFHDQHFSDFSTLLRCTFDEALDQMPDGSIDLLHIDGLHTYEAVRHDFEAWRIKLSDQAVVLFHDTNVRRDDFGVWRFWLEAKAQHPSFEFLHGNGLGVLVVGERPPAAVVALCGLDQPRDIASVRERFAAMGSRWLFETREILVDRERHGQLATLEREVQRLEAERAVVSIRIGEAEARVRQSEERNEEANARTVAAGQRIEQLEREAADAESQARIAEARVAEAETRAAAAADQARVEREAAEQARLERERARQDHIGAFQDIAREADTAKLRAADLETRGAALAEHARLEREHAGRRHGDALLEATRQADAANARAAEAEARGAASAAQARLELDQLLLERAYYRDERDLVMASTAWRITWPFRTLGHRLPSPVRRLFRAWAKLAWWSLTLRLFRKLQDRRLVTSPVSITSPVSMAPAAPEISVAPLPPVPAAPEPPGRAVAMGTPDHTDMSGRADAPENAVVTPTPAGTLLVFVSGESNTPGHMYRVARPMAAAAALGVRSVAIPFSELAARMGDIAAARVLYIWRADWTPALEAAVALARGNGARVIFDVDDLMIDPNLARTEIIDGIRSQDLTEDMVRSHYERIRLSMAVSDLCVTTTDALAKHMRLAQMPTAILPNGFDEGILRASRLARRRRSSQESANRESASRESDGLIRIGYATGSRTHQKDFHVCAEAVAAVLRAHPECRLVAFRSTGDSRPVLNLEEYPAFADLEHRVEWRYLVPLEQLPLEMARFDINLAPLEVGNVFCEAKSELKYVEGALVEVPTVASPTEVFRAAIRPGETGYLASTPEEWRTILERLVCDATQRRRIGRAAMLDVLWRFGPEHRVQRVASLLDVIHGGRDAARTFEADILRATRDRAPPPHVPDHEIRFQSDRLDLAEVTVVIPLHNYAHYVEAALDTVAAQTLEPLDLVVIDDCSTDNSLEVALAWANRHASRFNRLLVLRNQANAGLGFTRNVGFANAETPYVLPLDADNLLRPECAAECLRTLRRSGAAFAYPVIQRFGDEDALMGLTPYDPVRLANGNYIDAMALVSRAAWAGVGGYDHVRFGWEDYDFWCRLAEIGLHGTAVGGEPLADYRVHGSSMLHTTSDIPDNRAALVLDLMRRHPWLTVVTAEAEAEAEAPRLTHAATRAIPPNQVNRLATLLPLLRCPETGEELDLAADGDHLVARRSGRRWPIVEGRPLLFPGMDAPRVHPDSHISNELPPVVTALIRDTPGLVLNLSAGGTLLRHANVIEVEAAVFRHTDLVADAHTLPFADGSFEAVVSLNAFEHYRDPRGVAHEIRRLLRPGGRILVRTAFLQPLHEPPWHFYNCTRYGLEAWFEGFETQTLHVSDNFHPGHSIAWLASECEASLRRSVSDGAAESFLDTPLRRWVSLWRTPEGERDRDPQWSDLARLPQSEQEITAAGFEYVGRRL